MNDRRWQMYASARIPDDGHRDEVFSFFGPLGFAAQDTLGKRVVRVQLDVTDPPHPDDYWAWQDRHGFEPCHIGATEQIMTTGFLAGQPEAPGPREEQQAGLGRIIRLRVTVLTEVYLRSGRRNWRITGAL